MRTILLDDEPFSLTFLEGVCLQVPQLEVVQTFSESGQALSYLAQHPVDLVITDIEMPGMNGIEAARQLRALSPETGVIFVTGYEEYALPAFQMEAVAYIMKPCTPQALSSAVRRAALLAAPGKSLTIRTFGHFTVFIGGEPLRFSNGKAMELAALLVDRNGGVVTMEQAVGTLWEDRPYDDTVKRLYRKAVGYLHQIFAGTDFFVSDRGSCHIVPSKAECDYFTLLQNPTQAAGRYHGDYLLDYSWAEMTNGKLAHLCGYYDSV